MTTPKRLARPDNRFFVGKGGSGKSTLARYQLDGCKRVLIHDPNGEPEHAIGAHIATDERDLIDLLRCAGRGPIRICWRPYIAPPPPGEHPRDYRVRLFDWANEAAYHAGAVTVFADELDQFSFAGGLPPWMDTLVQQGRHRGCVFWGAARTVYRVPRDFTRNCGRIMVGRTTEPRDLAYWRDLPDFPVNSLPTLPDYAFVDWTERASKVRQSPFW